MLLSFIVGRVEEFWEHHNPDRGNITVVFMTSNLLNKYFLHLMSFYPDCGYSSFADYAITLNVIYLCVNLLSLGWFATMVVNKPSAISPNMNRFRLAHASFHRRMLHEQHAPTVEPVSVLPSKILKGLTAKFLINKRIKHRLIESFLRAKLKNKIQGSY